MSTPTASSELGVSPANRERLQQLFAHGTKQMAAASHDYANEMFIQCVLGDPANPLYFKTFIANLKKKFGNKKKKSIISQLTSSGKKTVASKKPVQVFKSSIEALKSDPWDISAFLAAGGACEELGYRDVAVEYYRAAVDSDPFNVDANRICAAALRSIADYDGALACVHRILKIKPADQESVKLRNDLTVEKTIHKGKYAMGDANQAREAAQSTGIIDETEDAMGRPMTYIEQVEKRIKKNPTDLANYVELAQYFYQQANYEKSEQYFIKAVKLSNDSADMTERLLDTQKQRLHTKVIALKEEFEKTRQESTKTEFYKTKEELDAKNLELARFRIQFHPNHAGYHYEYGVLLQQRKQIKEAIAEFQQAKSEVTRKGECFLALGMCFQMIRQTKLAMTHYQEAVTALPNNDNKKKALYLAAKLAYELEDYEKAEDYGHQLAAIDFSYKDLGDLLDKVAQKRHN
jgi:tetratricopeptide (TPR) repeat protein